MEFFKSSQFSRTVQTAKRRLRDESAKVSKITSGSGSMRAMGFLSAMSRSTSRTRSGSSRYATPMRTSNRRIGKRVMLMTVLFTNVSLGIRTNLLSKVRSFTEMVSTLSTRPVTSPT